MKKLFPILAAFALTILLSACKQSTTFGPNPVFEGWYADPEGFVDDKTIWVYPTSSLPYKEQTYLDAYSTTDLVHWEKHPDILTNQQAKWVWQAMWAPSVVKKDGLYYLFFAGNDVHE